MREIVLSLLLLLLTPSVIFAAPETAVLLAESGGGANLPGVLGGVLAFIAILLPFTLRAWARRNWDEEG